MATPRPAPAAPSGPPALRFAGADYWRTPDPEQLARFLRARPDLHEWQRAAQDQKRGKELTRFYHRSPQARAKVEPSGVVIERDGWVRLTGTDPDRCRRILNALASGTTAYQGTLFAIEGVGQ